MHADRRTFLTLIAGGVAASAWWSPAAGAAARPLFKAVAFDAFPIFDPRPIGALGEALFPGMGPELVATWRTKQFEYQWLRALGGRYADFLQTTEDALVFAAAAHGLDLTREKRRRLVEAYLALEIWPDVPAALASLRSAGVRLALLSNMTLEMLQSGIKSSGLEGVFEQVLSTDRIRTYKPDPRAYQMAADALALERGEILYAAFAGWDAAGAAWFGYPTFWVNRLNLPREEMGAAVEATGRDLTDLTRYVATARA